MSKESARASAEHRKAVVAAAKKAEKRRRLVGRIVVIVVVTRPSATPAAAADGQILPAASTGTTTVEAPATRVKNTSGVSGVLAFDTTGWPGDGSDHKGALEHDHVTSPVTYSVLPPVGGPHNPIWMNAGVYTKPVPTERAVHNLEHGAVWITYDPNLPKTDVKKLTAFVTKQSLIPEPASEVGFSGESNRYMDLSPWASNSLPTPIVISSWGYQLRVTSPTDPRLQKFVDTFRNQQKYSPEFGGPVDGIPVQSGGRAALDGGTKANPPGVTE
jgi:Protein of unknown function (DUF3105)